MLQLKQYSSNYDIQRKTTFIYSKYILEIYRYQINMLITAIAYTHIQLVAFPQFAVILMSLIQSPGKSSTWSEDSSAETWCRHVLVLIVIILEITIALIIVCSLLIIRLDVQQKRSGAICTIKWQRRRVRHRFNDSLKRFTEPT